MTKKIPLRAGVASKPANPPSPPVMPDTTDLADSRPGATLGTLRDAIQRAKARRNAKTSSPGADSR
jgi:hypothetical protein